MTDPLAARVNGIVVDAMKGVDFAFKLEEGGKQFSFNPFMLAIVRSRVVAGAIVVRDAPQYLLTKNAAWAYDDEKDEVLVDASKLGIDTAGPGLVHEYTHAACDVLKYYPFTRASNEAVAFLAQRLSMGFGVHIDLDTHPETKGGDSLRKKLFEEAEKLMDSKKLATDKAAQISAAEFKPLRDALVALYQAASWPPFQPDQIMDHLGITRPYP